MPWRKASAAARAADRNTRLFRLLHLAASAANLQQSFSFALSCSFQPAARSLDLPFNSRAARGWPISARRAGAPRSTDAIEFAHLSQQELSKDTAVFAVSAGNYQREAVSPPRESSTFDAVANAGTAGYQSGIVKIAYKSKTVNRCGARKLTRPRLRRCARMTASLRGAAGDEAIPRGRSAEFV